MKVGKHLKKGLTMCEICKGTVAVRLSNICEFCIADIQYVELSYRELA